MKQELDSLRDGAREIAWALRRRGLQWVEGNVERELIFARSALGETKLDEFYRQMHSYAFRLFLRDVIHQRYGVGVKELQRYVDGQTAEKYLEMLARWRLVDAASDGAWSLGSNLTRSFGETLECTSRRSSSENSVVPLPGECARPEADKAETTTCWPWWRAGWSWSK